jgi:hypothetical protein
MRCKIGDRVRLLKPYHGGPEELDRPAGAEGLVGQLNRQDGTIKIFIDHQPIWVPVEHVELVRPTLDLGHRPALLVGDEVKVLRNYPAGESRAAGHISAGTIGHVTNLSHPRPGWLWIRTGHYHSVSAPIALLQLIARRVPVRPAFDVGDQVMVTEEWHPEYAHRSVEAGTIGEVLSLTHPGEPGWIVIKAPGWSRLGICLTHVEPVGSTVDVTHQTKEEDMKEDDEGPCCEAPAEDEIIGGHACPFQIGDVVALTTPTYHIIKNNGKSVLLPEGSVGTVTSVWRMGTQLLPNHWPKVMIGGVNLTLDPSHLRLVCTAEEAAKPKSKAPWAFHVCELEGKTLKTIWLDDGGCCLTFEDGTQLKIDGGVDEHGGPVQFKVVREEQELRPVQAVYERRAGETWKKLE